MVDIKNRCTELWLSFHQGDEKAFRSMYDLSYPHLFRYGFSLVGDEHQVRDALQEVFISLYTRSQQQRAIDRIWVYMFTSLRNRLLDYLRRTRIPLPYPPEPARSVPSTEEEVVEAETDQQRQQWLQQQIGSLPRRQSEAIQLRYYQELDYPDIAEIMGVTVQVAYNYVSRGIHSLRNQLTPPGL